jgi:hypothetical protein
LKFGFLLAEISKVTEHLHIIVALASLTCLLLGNYYNGQINYYLLHPPTVASLLGLTTLTTTVTMSNTTSTTTVGCGPYICSYSTSWTVGTSLSNFTLPTPLQEAQAAAATAWNVKLFFDSLAEGLLAIFVILSVISIIAKKLSTMQKEPSPNKATSTNQRSMSVSVSFPQDFLLPTVSPDDVPRVKLWGQDSSSISSQRFGR